MFADADHELRSLSIDSKVYQLNSLARQPPIGSYITINYIILAYIPFILVNLLAKALLEGMPPQTTEQQSNSDTRPVVGGTTVSEEVKRVLWSAVDKDTAP